MTARETDPFLQQLSHVKPLAPEPSRTAAIRQRCHGALRKRSLHSPPGAKPRDAATTLAAVLIGGACAAFVGSLLTTVRWVYER